MNNVDHSARAKTVLFLACGALVLGIVVLLAASNEPELIAADTGPADHKYAEAVQICDADAIGGAAKIDQLDLLYGESARPEELDVKIGGCLLEAFQAEMDQRRAGSGN